MPASSSAPHPPGDPSESVFGREGVAGQQHGALRRLHETFDRANEPAWSEKEHQGQKSKRRSK